MKTVFTLLLIITSMCSYSQNITNTVGIGGEFIIKDNSTAFMTLSQSDGLINFSKNLRLQDTPGQQTGILYKNFSRFLHTFSPSGSSGANTFLGINSGNFSMPGTGSQSSSNTGIGYFTLSGLTTGSQNTGIGYISLSQNTSGSYNTSLGAQSMYNNTSGSSNTAIGSGTLFTNTSGNNNTAVGYSDMFFNTTGHDNTSIGGQTMVFNSTGYDNSAIGSFSLYSNTTGFGNTSSGNYSLRLNADGNWNSAFGYYALSSNTTGDVNTAIGNNSLASNTTGNYNTAIGGNTLYQNTTGGYNVAIGLQSGYNLATGNNNIIIGYDAQPTTGSVSNQITLGNNTITQLRCNVTSITSLSDKRDKKNISNLSLGLDFLMRVQPRQFNWDKREWYDNNTPDGSKMKETPTAGFIAQELDEVQSTENAEWLNLVLKDNPEKWEATPGNLLPIIVKAIQDLKYENDELRSENNDLKERLSKFEQVQNMLISEIGKIRPKETVKTVELSGKSK